LLISILYLTQTKFLASPLYTMLKQCDVVILHMLANCCAWNYTLVVLPELDSCQIYEFLAHSVFTLHIPTTWRRGFMQPVYQRNW